MRTLIRFSIIVLFLVLGQQAATAQTSPTRLRLKQLELAPDSTEHVITSDTNRVAVWTKLDSVLFGTVTGPLTPGRIPRATGTYTLGDGVLRDDGALLALGGATVSGYSFYDYSTGAWRLATGTTAQRPGSPTAGAMRYNTSNGTWEYYGAAAWEVPVKSSTTTGLFTAGSVLFADANGRAAQDNSNLFWDDTNNRLGIGTASPSYGLHQVSTQTTGAYFSGNQGNFRLGINNTYSVTPAASNAGFGLYTRDTLRFSVATYQAGTGNYDFTVYNDRTAISTLFIDGTTDNLGIKTASPFYALDINSTGAMRIPRGTTAQRPTGAEGALRYNTTITGLEVHNGTTWHNVAASTTLTNTRIPFANSNGILVDDAELVYNSTSNFLGVGVTPTEPIHAGFNTNSSIGARFKNSNAGAGAAASVVVANNQFLGTDYFGSMFKTSSGYTTYKIVKPNDFGFYNSAQAGDIAFINDNPTGDILFAAGGSSTSQIGLYDNGRLAIGNTSPQRTLHVTGEARITDLTTDTPTRIVGADADGDLGAISEGYGINITSGALEVDTTQIATQSDIAAISPTTLYTGDGTIATDRTVTISSDKTLTISGTTPDLPGYSFTEKKGYSSDWDTWGNYRLIYTDDYFTNFIQGILNYDSTVFVRLSAGDWVGDHFVSMQMDEAGNLSLSGFDDSGTSAGLNLSDNATVGGYGARLQGGAGIEFDTDTGGKFVYQVNNTTEAQLDATGLGLSGSTPAFTLDMENATDAIDMPGGTTAQRPTNESELLRYNSDNARMEYADGTNWRDLLPATGTTGSAILPSGTTAQRDGSPANGYIRYNSTIGELEAYVQSAWATVQASPRSYADMVGSGAAQYTVVSTEIIDTVTNIVAVGFTHSAGVLTYTGTTNKNFLVNISAVVGEADTDAATAVLRLYQNSSIKGVTQQYCALQDEKYAVSISRIVTLATNDTLDCQLATGGDWIVSNFYFNVTPID